MKIERPEPVRAEDGALLIETGVEGVLFKVRRRGVTLHFKRPWGEPDIAVLFTPEQLSAFADAALAAQWEVEGV